MSKQDLYSSYWLDDDIFENDINKDADEDSSLVRVIRLAAARRAVTNFVNILTGKNDFVVKFNTKSKDSFTDGKTVTIAADDKPEHFDSMVGLALHEASHLLLSDFTLLHFIQAIESRLEYPFDLLGSVLFKGGRTGTTIVSAPVDGEKNITDSVLRSSLHPVLRQWLPNPVEYIRDKSLLDRQKYAETMVARNVAYALPFSSTMMNGVDYAVRVKTILEHLKVLMNILEDRRIDKYVYTTAVGYRPYYDALYNRYFYTKDIGKNLKFNPEWRELTVENYINRLLYVFHPDASPDALPGLEKLIRKMNLTNIDRVGDRSSEWEKLLVAEGSPAIPARYENMPAIWKAANELLVRIFRLTGVVDYEPKNDMEFEDEDSIPGNGADDEGEDAGDEMDVPSDKTPRPVEPGKNGKAGTYDEKKAKRQMEAVRAIMDNNLKKKAVTKKEADSIAAMESAQGSIEQIEGYGIPKTRCLVTRRLTDDMFFQDWFIFRHWGAFSSNFNNGKRTISPLGTARTEKAIALGRRMGEILVHRLQVRNDPVLTKNTRLPSGGIDRRLLSQLGMDLESVFQKSRVDTFKPALLHLSLDASGSMGGGWDDSLGKWGKVQVVATALAYVGSKMRNVDTVISLRGGNDMPIVSIIFDSRVDHFNRFLRYFRHICSAGSTPEGICYHATMDMILKNTATHDVYFINFSDGEPQMNCDQFDSKGKKIMGGSFGYYGEIAIKHTRAMVEQMRQRGIKVLSYFISDHRSFMDKANPTNTAFRKMYGEDAQFVNVANATDVLRTLNRRLTARGVDNG